jgi:hypothetical protein
MYPTELAIVLGILDGTHDTAHVKFLVSHDATVHTEFRLAIGTDARTSWVCLRVVTATCC